MLKGLKIKKKETNKHQDLLEPKQTKKWKKDDGKEEEVQNKKQKKTFEDIINEKENDLLKLTDNIWSAFTKGKKDKAIQNCQELIIKQQVYMQMLSKNKNNNQSQSSQNNEDFDIINQQNNNAIFDDQDMQNQIEENNDNLNKKQKFGQNDQMLNNKKQEKIMQLQKQSMFDSKAMEFFNKYNTSTYDVDEMINKEYEDTNLAADDGQAEKDMKKNKKQQKYEERVEKRKERKIERDDHQQEKILSSCNYCMSNNNIWQEQVISMGTCTLLTLPKYQRYKNIYHVQIIPSEHYSSQTELDEEVYEEIRNFQKCLIQAFDAQDMECLFMELFNNVKSIPHLILDCLIMPRKYVEKAKLYFRKEMNDLEGEWTTHKKIIEIQKQKGGIIKQIPKKFPYFYVDFNLGIGYAHVIEEERKFDKHFGHEVVCSVLNIEKQQVLYPQKSERQQIFDQKIKFQKIWNDFDWTSQL